LDIFTCVKTYHEFDDEIPHIEGGIPILVQYLEYPYVATSPPPEEVHSTSSNVMSLSKQELQRGGLMV
jgi:hypothetical protein